VHFRTHTNIFFEEEKKMKKTIVFALIMFKTAGINTRIVTMRKTLAALGLLILCLWPLVSYARQSNVYSTTWNWNCNEFGSAGGSFGLPLFNPSLGVLTEIQLDYYNLAGNVITLINTYHQISGVSGGVTAHNQAILMDDRQLLTADMSVDNFPVPYNLAYVDSVTEDLGYTGTSGTFRFTDPAILYGYTGSGSARFNITAGTWCEFFPYPTSQIDSIALRTGRLELALTYFYDIPEPATLLILGFGGLVLRKRRA
jgi:hypothetical protein